MHVNHQINLACNVWDDLVNRLTHYDSEVQTKVDAFFDEIKQNLHVSHESNRILVNSTHINDDAILAALCNNSQEEPIAKIPDTFNISVSGFWDFDDIADFAVRIADEDVYQTQLCKFEGIGSEFSTSDLTKYPPLAA